MGGRHSVYSAMGPPAAVEQAWATMKVRKPHNQCSKSKADCSATRCCQMTNEYCWKESGKCEDECKAGESCTEMEGADTIVPVHNDSPGNSLFCFSTYFKNRGAADEDDYALDLLRTALKWKASIFACDIAKVYSDVDEALSSDGWHTVQVFPAHGDSFATAQRRKCEGGWGCNHFINTPFFRQVWNKIAAEAQDDVGNSYYSKSWLVKADADTVFFPERLKAKLAQQQVPETGLYIEHCKGVEYGFFGSLEVMSKTAAVIFFQHVEQCYTGEVDWKGERGDRIATQFGWYGEDLFAQVCMDYHGVKKIWDFDLVADGTCRDSRTWDKKDYRKWVPDPFTCGVRDKVVAYKPLKRPDQYFACLDSARKSR